jgi:hypothetical protein
MFVEELFEEVRAVRNDREHDRQVLKQVLSQAMENLG